MMNKNYIFEIAKKQTPKVKILGKKDWLRHDVISELKGKNNIGIEIGVARGTYSKRMVDSGKFKRFYGVDAYCDIHDTKEYISAINYIGHENSLYCLLRVDFNAALEIFPDEYFDFIYVDGFAHTGEDGGKTLVDWIKKLKVGGILAGDDYHTDWPLVVWAVNDLANKLNTKINVTLGLENEIYSKYPTWYIKKINKKNPSVNPLLLKLGMREKRRINFYRVGLYPKARKFLVRIMSALGLKHIILSLIRR